MHGILPSIRRIIRIKTIGDFDRIRNAVPIKIIGIRMSRDFWLGRSAKRAVIAIIFYAHATSDILAFRIPQRRQHAVALDFKYFKLRHLRHHQIGRLVLGIFRIDFAFPKNVIGGKGRDQGVAVEPLQEKHSAGQ